MKPVKRIEIVVESVHRSQVERLIADAGISGFTLVRDTIGRGERGTRDAEGLTSVFRNDCFIVAADPDAAEVLVASLHGLLERYGGMCLVSDALWLKH